MKYNLKGRYIVLLRKDTIVNLISFINSAIYKYGIESEVYPIIECTFNMVRNDDSTIYFAKIYIPVNK